MGSAGSTAIEAMVAMEYEVNAGRKGLCGV